MTEGCIQVRPVLWGGAAGRAGVLCFSVHVPLARQQRWLLCPVFCPSLVRVARAAAVLRVGDRAGLHAALLRTEQQEVEGREESGKSDPTPPAHRVLVKTNQTQTVPP